MRSTKRYVMLVDTKRCVGCGACAKQCPIDAIEMKTIPDEFSASERKAVVNSDICLGKLF